ncbi:MAG: tyrosine-type recombinase/integrase [Caldisericota bacterium]|nr:tyrosine-type recombinase/integrase [Caldisericota bacterium]
MNKNTLKENVRLFLEHLSSDKKIAANTVCAYTNDIAKFLHFVEKSGVTKWSAVDTKFIEHYLNKIKKDMSKASVKRNIASLKKLYKYLYERKLIEKRDFRKIGYFKNELQSYPEVLTVREVKLMTDAAKGRGFLGVRDKAMLLFLYSVGAKASEVCVVKVSDLDLKNHLFIYRNHIGKREVPFCEELIPFLKDYLKARKRILAKLEKKDSGYLFLNRSGDKLTRQSIYLLVKKYAKESDINKKVTPCTLRHSVTSHLFFFGNADLDEMKRIFGYITTPLVLKNTMLPEEYTYFVYLKKHPLFKHR